MSRRPAFYKVVRGRTRTAFERALVAVMIWDLLCSGKRPQVAASPFAFARAVRRLERSGSLRRAPGSPLGFEVGPEPREAIRVVIAGVPGAGR